LLVAQVVAHAARELAHWRASWQFRPGSHHHKAAYRPGSGIVKRPGHRYRWPDGSYPGLALAQYRPHSLHQFVPQTVHHLDRPVSYQIESVILPLHPAPECSMAGYCHAQYPVREHIVVRRITGLQTLRQREQVENTRAIVPCASGIVLTSLLPVSVSRSRANRHQFQIRAAAEYAHGDNAKPFPPRHQSAHETMSGQETPA